MQEALVLRDVFRPNLARRVCFLLLTGLLASGCANPSLTSPGPEQFASITAGPSVATATLNPSPFTATRTSTPTLTVVPNRTSTPLPKSPVPTVPIPAGDLPAGLIAFIGVDRQLWLMESDGQNQRQLTWGEQVQSPTWSPDGKTLGYIRVVKPGYREAVLYALDTQHRHTVIVDISTPWFYEALSGLSWSPNGRYLILDSGTGMERHLVIVEVATGRQLHSLTEVDCYAWSLDGQQLAFGQAHPLEPPLSLGSGGSVDIAVLEIDRGTVHMVLEGTSQVLYRPKAWLPDNRLFYSRLDWDESRLTSTYSEWTITMGEPAGEPQSARDIPPAFDPQTVLEGLPAEFRDPSTGYFSWSADGRWVVFPAGKWPNRGIYLFEWQGNEPPYRLADGTEPAWQPVPHP